MTGLWIRVNARLASDADVRAFAKVLFPRLDTWMAVAATCGLLVTLWGRVVDEQEDGAIGSRDDDVIEEWANWRGKAGSFSAPFRSAFVVDGKIVRWDEYQGKLIQRRERDRERKRGDGSSGHPPKVRKNSAGIPQEERAASVGHVDGDSNGNDTAHSLSGREILLRGLPDHSRPAWLAEMNGRQQGMHGPVMTEAQVDEAARQYVGNGHLENPSLRHFSGFLTSVAKRKEPPPPRDETPPSGSRRGAPRKPIDPATTPYATALSEADV